MTCAWNLAFSHTAHATQRQRRHEVQAVDRKVRLFMTPLPEGNWERMKRVVIDPSLRDPISIGHPFTDEMSLKLKSVGVVS